MSYLHNPQFNHLFDMLPNEALLPCCSENEFFLLCKKQQKNISNSEVDNLDLDIKENRLFLTIVISLRNKSFAEFVVNKQDVDEEVRKDFGTLINKNKLHLLIKTQDVKPSQLLYTTQTLSLKNLTALRKFFEIK